MEPCFGSGSPRWSASCSRCIWRGRSAYRPHVGVANLSFGDVEANQALELARIRQEEVLFPAPEADVDDDVALANLGHLKHLEAELLLALLVQVSVPETVYP